MSYQPSIGIASWNIHASRDRLNKSFDPWVEMNKHRIDVLCVQEYPMHSEDVGQSYRRKIKDTTGFPSASVLELSPGPFNSDSRPFQAIAVLSRYLLADARSLRLDGTKYLPSTDDLDPHDKGALAVTVRAPLGDVRVICVHGFPFHHFGIHGVSEGPGCGVTKAFHRLDRFIADEAELLPEGTPLILAGDFNTEQRWELLQEPRRLGLRSLFLGRGPTRPDGRNHDDIMVSDGLRACDPEIHETKSDHHLLTVRIRDRSVPATQPRRSPSASRRDPDRSLVTGGVR